MKLRVACMVLVSCSFLMGFVYCMDLAKDREASFSQQVKSIGDVVVSTGGPKVAIKHEILAFLVNHGFFTLNETTAYWDAPAIVATKTQELYASLKLDELWYKDHEKAEAFALDLFHWADIQSAIMKKYAATHIFENFDDYNSKGIVLVPGHSEFNLPHALASFFGIEKDSVSRLKISKSAALFFKKLLNYVHNLNKGCNIAFKLIYGDNPSELRNSEQAKNLEVAASRELFYYGLVLFLTSSKLVEKSIFFDVLELAHHYHLPVIMHALIKVLSLREDACNRTFLEDVAASIPLGVFPYLLRNRDKAQYVVRLFDAIDDLENADKVLVDTCLGSIVDCIESVDVDFNKLHPWLQEQLLKKFKEKIPLESIQMLGEYSAEHIVKKDIITLSDINFFYVGEFFLAQKNPEGYRRAFLCYQRAHLGIGPRGYTSIRLAEMYFNGYGVKRDPLIAMRYLNAALSNGCSAWITAEATLKLAEMQLICRGCSPIVKTGPVVFAWLGYEAAEELLKEAPDCRPFAIKFFEKLSRQNANMWVKEWALYRLAEYLCTGKTDETTQTGHNSLMRSAEQTVCKQAKKQASEFLARLHDQKESVDYNPTKAADFREQATRCTKELECDANDPLTLWKKNAAAGEFLAFNHRIPEIAGRLRDAIDQSANTPARAKASLHLLKLFLFRFKEFGGISLTDKKNYVSLVLNADDKAIKDEAMLLNEYLQIIDQVCAEFGFQ